MGTLDDKDNFSFLHIFDHAEIVIALEDARVGLAFRVKGNGDVIYTGICFAGGLALEQEDHRPARLDMIEGMVGGC
jgi:hypothetical protein